MAEIRDNLSSQTRFHDMTRHLPRVSGLPSHHASGHSHLLNHHKARCRICQGQGRLQLIIQSAVKVINHNLPSLQDLVFLQVSEGGREDCASSLPPWTQPLRGPPHLQEAVVHQDQDHTPQEKFLPHCCWTNQQNQRSSLTPPTKFWSDILANSVTNYDCSNCQKEGDKTCPDMADTITNCSTIDFGYSLSSCLIDIIIHILVFWLR